jgi:hypothetical protein
MNKIVLSSLIVLCVGCCRPIVVPSTPPTVVAEPEIRVASLPPEAGWVDVSTAYKLDLAEWVAYGRKLQVLLWGKTTPAAPPPPAAPLLPSHEPGAMSPEPGARSPEPGAMSHEPGAMSHEPGARSHEP